MIRILLSTKLGELRWTQADLARATGIRPSTINEIYHDLATRVNLEHLDLICEALNCELSEILIRIPNKVPETKTKTGAPKKTEIKRVPPQQQSLRRLCVRRLFSVYI